jgi:hypothetical protein
VSFRAADNRRLRLLCSGLNSDPTTDQNYASLDYAWYCAGNNASGAGRLILYESGAAITDYGAGQYTSSTVFSIRYDGQWVRYYRDSSLMREKYAPGLTLFVDSSFADPGAVATTSTSDRSPRRRLRLFARAGIARSVIRNVIKQGGGGGLGF